MKRFIATILFLSGVFPLFGQFEFPSLSPKGTIRQVVGTTTVEIEYERPAARGRKVFGDLVPLGNLWRTGAGNCTTIRFDQSVMVGEQWVPAGHYSIFTIPGTDQWVVILNSDTSLYGTSGYRQENDVIRFTVIPEKTDRFYESLTFDIDLIPNNATIYLSWEQTRIHFDLHTSTDEDFMNYIDGFLLTGKEADGNIYANAAEHLYYLNTRLEDAILLTDMALAKNGNSGFARRVKMELFEKLQDYPKALEVVEIAIEMESDEDEQAFWREQRERIMKNM